LPGAIGVDLFQDAIDPTVAERFFDGVVVRDAAFAGNEWVADRRARFLF
jgi:hypothetical protein